MCFLNITVLATYYKPDVLKKVAQIRIRNVRSVDTVHTAIDMFKLSLKNRSQYNAKFLNFYSRLLQTASTVLYTYIREEWRA